MKLLLKMVLLVTALLFVMSYDGDTHVKIKAEQSVTSSSRESPYPNENIAPFSGYMARNNVPPPDWEEIRRQRNIERSANTEWIKESTGRYSPDSWYLLMSYDSLPVFSSAPLPNGGAVSSQKTAETFSYLRGRTRIELLSSMEKNVHEIAHGYFDQNMFRYLLDNNLDFNPDNAQGLIYISPHQSFFVSFPFNAMFPSGDLAIVIPADLRTYRFDTYINGTTSTQSDGVIGLLNELHAYYLGSRYCFDMLEAYKTAAGSDEAGLFEWVTHTQSTMSAYYEFDFFISEYLLFMKRKYPQNYELLRSYDPFRESYIILRTLYNELIDKYVGRINAEMGLLNSSGYAEARLADGWLWVKTGSSHISSGTPLFSDERKTLMPVLESRRYREVEEDFGIK